MRRSILMVACAAVLFVCARAGAQTASPNPADPQAVTGDQKQAEVLAKVQAAIAKRLDIELRAATSGMLGPVVTGAPYSAMTTTESIQTLADGNRIVQRSTYNLARDGLGRVRREELTDTGEVRTVMIMDPVANMSVVLDPASRTARRVALLGSKEFTPVLTNGQVFLKEGTIDWSTGGITVTAVPRTGAAAAGAATSPAPPAGQMQPQITARGRGGAGFKDARRESLGTQNIEGVIADGSRTVSTIPAGQIGNERPIDIVSEQWYSKDLRMTVMSRYSDPRTGETIYRVTNIRRGEPDPSLFQIPSDYTVTKMMEVLPDKVKK